MNRPIKFRGVTSKGKIVYGYAFKYFKQKSWYILDEHAEQWKIKPESLAQLVGYDANGKEVYEGDTVLRYDSKEEFVEAPENGVLREVVSYTQVNPDLEGYYCLLKEQRHD